MPRTQADIVNRANRIIDLLLQKEYVSVTELTEQFQVSAATIRKDLSRLEASGLLRRTHGGAMSVEPLLYEPFRRTQSFRENEEKWVEEKRNIALVAARLIEPGEVVAFTGGTTATQVARCIRNGMEITVVTNAINIAMELSNRDHLTIFVPGGYLRGGMFSLTGPNGIASVKAMQIDRMFIGVNGIDADAGLTTLVPEQASIHRAMIRQTACKIVVADHTKIGQVYSAPVCPVDDVDMLITDSHATPQQIDSLRQRGLTIITADSQLPTD